MTFSCHKYCDDIWAFLKGSGRTPSLSLCSSFPPVESFPAPKGREYLLFSADAIPFFLHNACCCLSAKPAPESANLVHAPFVLSLCFAPATIIFSPLCLLT
jgi:hypothetical protein